MFLMEDPEVTQFARPLSPQEKEDQGAVNFEEEGYYLGVVPFINGSPRPIPPQVGHIAAKRIKQKHLSALSFRNQEDYINLVDCKELMPVEMLETSILHAKLMVESGLMYCVEPSDWTMSNYKDESGPNNEFETVLFGFEVCKNDDTADNSPTA